jgi:hypothetical protein
VTREYVILTPDALLAQTGVDAADVRKQYEDNLKQYAKAEQRQASHILIAVKPDASDADKAAAKAKADALVAQLKKNPAQFAELAKQNSQDPGSAPQGGDLGLFARDGSMVKPFEDAAFSAKQGDIVGPVQTDFGWHIIRVTGVKAAKTQSFDEAKAGIELELKRAQAQRKFAEAADQFQNLVYEQAEYPAGRQGAQPDRRVAARRARRFRRWAGNAKFATAVPAPSRCNPSEYRSYRGRREHADGGSRRGVCRRRARSTKSSRSVELSARRHPRAAGRA